MNTKDVLLLVTSRSFVQMYRHSAVRTIFKYDMVCGCALKFDTHVLDYIAFEAIELIIAKIQ